MFYENEVLYSEEEIQDDYFLYYIEEGKVEIYVESLKGNIQKTVLNTLSKG